VVVAGGLGVAVVVLEDLAFKGWGSCILWYLGGVLFGGLDRGGSVVALVRWWWGWRVRW
ncbi:hypothetical protein A2U01_0062550, partial [Trifolium medium]|nr:hypothetical protein [Trifolium medium]